VAFVLAAELVALGGIASGFGSVAHFGQFGRGEKLELPHGSMISHPRKFRCPALLVDHAILMTSEGKRK
jgi:hypothetical protein